MPITIRTRDYGPELFAAVKERAGTPAATSAAAMQATMETLF
jgi:hypothetical protein